MNYNVIENGDYILGKADDIIKYLLKEVDELANKYVNDEIDAEQLTELSNENIKVVKEIREMEYQNWVILKLYRNEFDKLTFEDLHL